MGETEAGDADVWDCFLVSPQMVPVLSISFMDVTYGWTVVKKYIHLLLNKKNHYKSTMKVSSLGAYSSNFNGKTFVKLVLYTKCSTRYNCSPVGVLDQEPEVELWVKKLKREENRYS